MQKKPKLSSMEIVLVCFLVGSLIISFLQARQGEKH